MKELSEKKDRKNLRIKAEDRRKLVVFLHLQNRHPKTQKTGHFSEYIGCKLLIDSLIQKQLSLNNFPLKQGLRHHIWPQFGYFSHAPSITFH